MTCEGDIRPTIEAIENLSPCGGCIQSLSVNPITRNTDGLAIRGSRREAALEMLSAML